MTPAQIADHLSSLDWSTTSTQHRLAISAALETLRGRTVSNVIPFPVHPRTCWTTLCNLQGVEWVTSSHFGPGGAWSWIVETVAHEHGCSEDAVGNSEDLDGLYDGDDLVTVDGLLLYRIRHLVK